MKSMVLSVWTGFSQSTDLCGPKPSPKKYRCRSRFSWVMKTSQTTSPLQRSTNCRNLKGSAEIDPDLIRNLGRRQSEMVVDLLVGSRHAKLIDPQGEPFRAYPSVPALCRSEEHTSELQSRGHLVCRLLLEKKNKYQ